MACLDKEPSSHVPAGKCVRDSLRGRGKERADLMDYLIVILIGRAKVAIGNVDCCYFSKGHLSSS